MITLFWLVSTGKTRAVEMIYEKSSLILFVYVTILSDKFFRLMFQLFYSSRVTKFFQKKWLKWPF